MQKTTFSIAVAILIYYGTNNSYVYRVNENRLRAFLKA